MAINAERLQVSVEGGGGADDLAGGLDNLAGSALNARQAVGYLGIGLAALSAGGIAAATKSAYDFESAMADVQKVTSADTAAQLEGELMSLAETIPIPRRELVTLAEQAGKFGIEGSENISRFVETVGKIGAATDLAAEEAGTRFAKIAGAVGLPYSEIQKLGDATNKLADSFKTDAGEISDTAVRASNVLSQRLGLGAEETLALSASMNEVSASSRLAAGDLKRAAEAMMDPKRVGDIAGALGMTTSEFKTLRSSDPYGLMQKIAKGMAEGGQKATDLQVALGTRAARGFSKLGSNATQTEKALTAANKQFEEGGSLAREMSIRTDTAAGKWQLFKNKVQNAATTTGQRFLPILKDVLGALNTGIGVLGDINEATDGWLGTITLVGGLLGGAVMAIGAFAGALSTSTIAAAAASGAVGALGTALTILTGPIGIAIAAAVALYAAYRTNFLGTKEIVDGAMGRMRQIIDTHIGPMINKVVTLATTIYNALAPVGQWLITNLGPAFAMVGQMIGASLDATIGQIMWFADLGLSLFSAFLSLLNGDVDGALAVLEGLWQRTLDGIINWIKSWDIVKWLGNKILDAVATAEKYINKIPGVQVSMTDKVREQINNSGIDDAYGNTFSRAEQLSKNVLNQIRTNNQSSLNNQERDIMASGMPEAYKRQLRQSRLNAQNEMGMMQTANGQSLSSMYTQTGQSQVPTAYNDLFSQSKLNAQTQLGGIEMANAQALSGMETQTRQSNLPQATQTVYQQSIEKQREKLKRLRKRHKQNLKLSKQDTEKSKMYEGFATMYAKAANRQQVKLDKMESKHHRMLTNTESKTRSWSMPTVVQSKYNSAQNGAIGKVAGMEQTHSQGLASMETDTRNWSMPTVLESKYNSAQNGAVGKIAGIEQGHSQGLGQMQTDTQNWGMPGDVNSKYATAASNQSTKLGAMYSENNRQFTNMMTDTAAKLGQILTQITTQFGNMLSVITNQMGAARSRFSGEMGTMESNTQSATGSMVNMFSAAFSRISALAGRIASEAASAAAQAESSLSDATSARSSARSAARDAASAASRARSYTSGAGQRAVVGMASGGRVLADGIVKLHENEHVLSESDINRSARPPIETEGNSGGGGGLSIGRVVVHATSEREGRRAGRGFVDELRADNFDSA
ncbi:phage tail tape measure protein [Halomarina rubra]|uniref:Phage tail tape measure protein n=1 Tax=Halomarina rubra TaxID=2071873 RepID=A0ABD6AZU1_9EURY|nr:phage tail tape measure protein [Halomarina rubra]